MQNLNVLKVQIPALTGFSSAEQSIVLNTTGCETLAFQFTVTDEDPGNLSGGSVIIQKSLDGNEWFADGESTAITTDADLYLSATQPLNGNFYRLAFGLSAGELSVDNIDVYGKGFI